MIKHNLKMICFLLAVFTSIAAGKASADDSEITLREYLSRKLRGDYAGALNILTAWTKASDDPVLVETNIIRMGELIVHPEFIDNGILSCDAVIAGNRLMKENAVLRSRAELLKISLLLRKGSMKDAAALRRQAGYLDRFRIIGPFKNEDTGDFDIAYPVEKLISPGDICTGKLYAVNWFAAETDPAGVLDIGERGIETANSFYYASAEFHTETAGDFRIFLGKTGYTDILLDGKAVFQNRKRHGFAADQYLIDVSLTAGRHRLLIKTGDSKSAGIKLSVRITDAAGKGIQLTDKIRPGAITGTIGKSASSFFPALAALVNKPHPTAVDCFTKGYLFYSTGLDSDTGNEAAAYLNEAAGNPALRPAALFYLGMAGNDISKRENYFRESVRQDPSALEALEQIGWIKIQNNFVYEAFALDENLKAMNPSSPAGKILEAECYMNKGWYVEAWKPAEALKTMGYRSACYRIEGRILRAQKKMIQASRMYELLCSMDRSSKAYAGGLLDCFEEAGLYDRARSLLEGMAVQFPGDAMLRYRLAVLVRNFRGASASIPYLSAALNISPFNTGILQELGCAHLAGGRKDTAQYYLQRALAVDPNNFELRNYLEMLSGPGNELFEYQVKGDPAVLSKRADPYMDEPAVVLLDEVAVRILADGSYEKSVRKITKINDAGVLENFSEQFVLFNPSTDRIENMRCIVINDGARIESSGNYTRSLSDPESRMYYDMQARIIPVSSLRAGSVIDFRYRITSRDGDYFKGYYGERINAGGEYRTMMTNIIVSRPENKKIYCHLKGIKKSDLKEESGGGVKILQVRVLNSPPNRKEPAMPEITDTLPCVMLTSFRDWSEVQRWYMALTEDRMVLSAEMKRKVAEFAGEKNDREKIRKIFNHVNGEIRYVGFELGIGGIQPRPADLTYKTGMGDCKDITMVLAAMLREAGFDAQIALVRTRDRGGLETAVPFPGQFNHAVCYVNWNEGIFLDATSKMAGYRELPLNDRDISAFVINDSGYRFINPGGAFYAPNEDASETTAEIGKNGKALLHRTIIKSGDQAPQARLELADQDGKMRTISEYWNDRYAGARVTNLKIRNMDLENPVMYSYEAEIPSLLMPVDGCLVFKSFLIPSEYYRAYAAKKKRFSELLIAGKSSIKSRITYHLPAGYAVEHLPKSERLSIWMCDAQFSYSLKGSVIEVDSTINFNTYRIDKKSYDRFRDLARFIDRKENEAIVLREKLRGNTEK